MMHAVQQVGHPHAGEAPPLGAILAGGRSRRMGAPKAAVELGGRPLVRYPLRAVADAGLEVVIVARPESQLPGLDCRVVREPPGGQPHPLSGVLAALRAADGRPAVVVACDMPFVTPELVAWLAGQSGTALAVADGRPQPLLARYAPSAAASLAASLARKEPLTAAAMALRPSLIGEPELRRFGDPGRLVFNVNSPEELAFAERLLGAPAGN